MRGGGGDEPQRGRCRGRAGAGACAESLASCERSLASCYVHVARVRLLGHIDVAVEGWRPVAHVGIALCVFCVSVRTSVFFMVLAL